MFIAVKIVADQPTRWHSALVDALTNDGHTVAVQLVEKGDASRPAGRLVLEAEQRLRIYGADWLGADAPAAELHNCSHIPLKSIDLLVDLTDNAEPIQSLSAASPAVRVLRALFDGNPGEGSLLASLLHGQSPLLTVDDSECAAQWFIGLPANEAPYRMTVGYNQAVSRLVEGLQKIVRQIAASDDDGTEIWSCAGTARGRVEQKRLAAAPVAQYAVRRATRKLRRLRDKVLGRSEHWAVAWRRVTPCAPLPDTIDIGDYHVVADDGRRFYADPFVMSWQGKQALFVEELDFGRGYGTIASAQFQPDGSLGPFETVLDTGAHLSYPYLFEDNGTLYMMPESHSIGRVELYACTSFPSGWRKVGTLIDEPLHDATLFRHGGRYWIAAGNTYLKSSTWDSLHLFVSNSLEGPWTAHRNNPVIIDRASARPAGPPWLANGELFRPAQDCSNGYGGAVVINRVRQLDDATFAEEEVGRIAIGDGGRYSGPHTYMRHGDIEVIDICTHRPPRF